MVPKSALTGLLDVVTFTKEEYRVGRTPLEVNLEPGEYVVTVKCGPMYFRGDGEHTTIQELTSDGSGFVMVGKVYDITVKTGHKGLVVALFWPKSQSMEDFVKTLPKDQLFPRFEMEAFKPDLESHAVPQKDWASLLLMFRTTGKAIWYGEDKSRYLLVYCTELAPQTLVAIRPAKD